MPQPYISSALPKGLILTISLCAPAILKRISRPETLNFKMGLWSSYMGVGVSLAVLVFLFYSNT